MAKKKPVKKISDAELKVIVDAEVRAALGAQSGELSDERTRAMDRYLGKPLGTEMEGRSQVHTRDVLDTIEWILPSLMRVFLDQDSVVLVDPVGAEDEEAAEQETDYLNYLFFKKNPGFLLLYTWFKDALMMKTGTVKHWVEEEETQKRETYVGLTDQEMAVLLSDPDYELIEHESMVAYSDTLGQFMSHSATFIYHEKKYCVRIDNVAPEDHLISTDARSINPKLARFNACIVLKSVSDLREEGFSDAEIEQMEDASSIDWSPEGQSRRHLTDEKMREYADANEAMQQKKIYECYLRADKNGDGVAELLRVWRSGDFIDAEEFDGVPLNTITPVILTHKHHGLSVADLMYDLQEIRTALFRSYLDNIYQTINGTTYYDQNRVNVDDMLTSKPYGIRAVDGTPVDSILHIAPNGLPSQAFTLFELTDGLKQQRMGDFQAQIDPKVLSQAQTGVVMKMAMEAKAKVEMIARIFAETGVKELFRDLHEMARKHLPVEEVVKLRNKWVPVNPKSWKERTDFTIRVGLGNLTKEEKLMNLNDIITKQHMLIEKGGMGAMLTPQNVHEAHSDYIKALGHPNADKYFANPQSIPPPPPRPDPQMAAVQATMQIEQSKTEQRERESQRDAMLKAQELQLKQQIDTGNQRLEHMALEITRLKEQAKLANDRTKNALEARATEIQKNMDALQSLLDQYTEKSKQSVEVYKAELDAGVKLLTQTKQQLGEYPAMQAKSASNEKETQALIAKLLDRIDEMHQMMNRKAPKKIERDMNGMIVSVNGQRVMRDMNGRIEGLE